MCPISFKIYRMKLNEVHFSSGTSRIHFLDKPYQEIDVKSNSNSVLIFKIRKTTVRFGHALLDFNSLYLFILTFAIKLIDAIYKSH